MIISLRKNHQTMNYYSTIKQESMIITTKLLNLKTKSQKTNMLNVNDQSPLKH